MRLYPTLLHSLFLLATLAQMSGCTGQIPGSFRLAATSESFSPNINLAFNSKVDLLWVVDNSASMERNQDQLRKGFNGFAQKYLQPNWDMQLAVITTDMYLSHPSFNTYLNTSVNGYKPKQLIPVLGPDYSKLLPGIHDGPIPGLCVSQHYWFYSGQSDCQVRAAVGAPTGPGHCLNPSGGETQITQCTNPTTNNTIHTGKPILNTLPPAGTPGDATWVNQLVDNFILNVTVGGAGIGSERGIGSVLQLMSDNEPTTTAFFRKDSLRVIIFVSDEEDQTMTIPASPPGGFTPFYYNHNHSAGNPCPNKTIDGYTYRLDNCPNNGILTPVATLKTQLDQFFLNLDNLPASGNPNYMVVSIVPENAASIQALQNAIDPNQRTIDRGDRYIELGNLVGNGSSVMDIGSNDYSVGLDAIGATIAQKKASFTLSREPTSGEDVLVRILHADGSSNLLAASTYSVSGKVLTITDLISLLAIKSTDQIAIVYNPRTLN